MFASAPCVAREQPQYPCRARSHRGPSRRVVTRRVFGRVRASGQNLLAWGRRLSSGPCPMVEGGSQIVLRASAIFAYFSTRRARGVEISPAFLGQGLRVVRRARSEGAARRRARALINTIETSSASAIVACLAPCLACPARSRSPCLQERMGKSVMNRVNTRSRLPPERDGPQRSVPFPDDVAFDSNPRSGERVIWSGRVLWTAAEIRHCPRSERKPFDAGLPHNSRNSGRSLTVSISHPVHDPPSATMPPTLQRLERFFTKKKRITSRPIVEHR